MTPAFCVKELCKTQRTGKVRAKAIRGVDFTAAKREVIVMLGALGSGKSTFPTIINGLERASSGEV